MSLVDNRSTTSQELISLPVILSQPENQRDPVNELPRDVLACIFRLLNAHEYSNTRWVSKAWRVLVIDPKFTTTAHWYPSLNKLCGILKKHISRNLIGKVQVSLQSIVTDPKALDLEGYRDVLVFTLSHLNDPELKRLASLKLALPEAYKTILQKTMKVFHTQNVGEHCWSYEIHLVNESVKKTVLNSTGVTLPLHERFISSKVSVSDEKPGFCIKDEHVLFPFRVLKGKKDSEVLDFKLIDGNRMLHKLRGNSDYPKFEDSLDAILNNRVINLFKALPSKLVNRVLFPDLLDQLKVNAFYILKNLKAEIRRASQFPEIIEKIKDFQKYIKNLKNLPDLNALKKELKAHLEFLPSEVLIKIKAFKISFPPSGVRESFTLIPEGWETIVQEILEERKADR